MHVSPPRMLQDGRTALLSAALQGHIEAALHALLLPVSGYCQTDRLQSCCAVLVGPSDNAGDTPLSQPPAVTAQAQLLIQKKAMALRQCFLAPISVLQPMQTS